MAPILCKGDPRNCRVAREERARRSSVAKANLKRMEIVVTEFGQSLRRLNSISAGAPGASNRIVYVPRRPFKIEENRSYRLEVEGGDAVVGQPEAVPQRANLDPAEEDDEDIELVDLTSDEDSELQPVQAQAQEPEGGNLEMVQQAGVAARPPVVVPVPATIGAPSANGRIALVPYEVEAGNPLAQNGVGVSGYRVSARRNEDVGAGNRIVLGPNRVGAGNQIALGPNGFEAGNRVAMGSNGFGAENRMPLQNGVGPGNLIDLELNRAMMAESLSDVRLKATLVTLQEKLRLPIVCLPFVYQILKDCNGEMEAALAEITKTQLEFYSQALLDVARRMGQNEPNNPAPRSPSLMDIPGTPVANFGDAFQTATFFIDVAHANFPRR